MRSLSGCPSPWVLPAPVSSAINEHGNGWWGSEGPSEGICPKPLEAPDQLLKGQISEAPDFRELRW